MLAPQQNIAFQKACPLKMLPMKYDNPAAPKNIANEIQYIACTKCCLQTAARKKRCAKVMLPLQILPLKMLSLKALPIKTAAPVNIDKETFPLKTAASTNISP